MEVVKKYIEDVHRRVGEKYFTGRRTVHIQMGVVK